MAKTLADAKIKTATQRSSLCKLDGPGPHWYQVRADIHLGYRQSRRGDSWLVRWYVGDRKYKQRVFGLVDDTKPDQEDFSSAKAQAEEIGSSELSKLKMVADGAPLSVADAIREYGARRDNQTRELRGRDDVKSGFNGNMSNHVLSAPIAAVPLFSLTNRDLSEWVQGMVGNISPATIRRVRNDMKAALNAAGKRWSDKLPSNFASVVQIGLEIKKGTLPAIVKKPNTDDAETDDIRHQILTDEQVKRVIAAALEIDIERGEGGDLYRMVLLLAVTGMRLSQIARMRVSDVDISANRLNIPGSRKGNKSETRADDATKRRVDPHVTAALQPILSRSRNATLLERRRMVKQGWEWIEVGRGPWQSVDLSKPWISIRDRAQLPSNVTPYALRHSSICRAIEMRIPTLLVAKRHDTGVEMIEQHYARFIEEAFPERDEDVFMVAA
ncbi:tyrosine-type recombinase/integrase [Rhizobium sp. B230/85]|uniref:tyrosine-type recombinase/integrase n=1 Tax=unclassified Rhizobium TaxID=2613769 RepID=UPI001ADA1690|nr:MULTISPECIES: tyrosine-type recombinase/integrase [unclassified Rhizobium]MBO9131719.1 tyrosine-type recombinase/integrase [Rhizobium sp. B209b/85]QXZ95713.1 tyrosine-type recombinase/integrase [Rhizobium sp. B230/85]